jgi:hypothetical protein
MPQDRRMLGFPHQQERADHRPLVVGQVAGIRLPFARGQPYAAAYLPPSRRAGPSRNRATTNAKFTSPPSHSGGRSRRNSVITSGPAAGRVSCVGMGRGPAAGQFRPARGAETGPPPSPLCPLGQGLMRTLRLLRSAISW